ncbi:hypothetical protein GWK47_052626 [Chionoecetes opilio]|uniref:Uncharacterized protein n=1 Tax=Chionoecetes opilio TaxID=41210 RepID=A0A8J4Y1A5_CHIOP|nr:hypothetical protein GWK47_052626 [Chionoecetes opilio]
MIITEYNGCMPDHAHRAPHPASPCQRCAAQALQAPTPSPAAPQCHSLLGAAAAALILMVVAFVMNNQGQQRVAGICVAVAGLTVVLCLAARIFHHYTPRRRPEVHCDAPPSYKDAWRRAFYSRRMTEIQDCEDTVSNTSFSFLPHSNPEIQLASPSNVSPVAVGSPTHISGCSPDISPHSSSATTIPTASSSSTCRHHYVTCSAINCSHHYVDESQVAGSNEPPSYDEAMQSSLQKLRQDTEDEGDQ